MKTSFKTWIFNSLIAKRFIIISSLICIAYYFLELKNGRAQMADFRVYYDAANAFIHDTQLYGKSFGVSSGFYKYSPFACLPFIPLAILPYQLASIIYYLIITSSIIWFALYVVYTIRQTQELKERSDKNIGWILFIISLFMADHLERELHLGNVNLFLLIGALFIYQFALAGRQITAGVLYGLLLLFKPHFLILLPYFIWKKKWKLMSSSAAAFGMGLLLPILFKGFEKNKLLLSEWLGAMREHNVKLEESPNTIYGIVNHFILQHTGGQMLVIVLLIAVGSLFVAFMIRNQKTEGNAQLRFIEFFFLIAIIPNLAHTDTEHFMWTWPLIAYCIISLFTYKLKYAITYAVLLALAFIPYCINSPDIVGRQIRFLFDEGGLLGMANLVIVGISLLIYSQIKHHTNIILK